MDIQPKKVTNVRRVPRHQKQFRMMLLVVLVGFIAVWCSAESYAYTNLQVLLPGENSAPGTTTGKTGSPRTQTVGIPFNVQVRACDDSWYTDPTVTNLVLLGSTDESATLPGSTMLVSGEVQLVVVLNSAGSFTFSATDESDPTIPEATSAFIDAYAVQGFEFSRISQKNQLYLHTLQKYLQEKQHI